MLIINEKVSPESEILIKNLETVADLDNVEYVLLTDGSGHYSDQIGGYAACLVNLRDNTHSAKISCGCMTNTSTPRQEFTALIEGVRLATFEDDFYCGVNIAWFSDCESLTKSVSGEYERKGNIDLWKLFEHYEQQINLKTTHIPRTFKNKALELCDLHASALRLVLKNYIEAC